MLHEWRPASSMCGSREDTHRRADWIRVGRITRECDRLFDDCANLCLNRAEVLRTGDAMREHVLFQFAEWVAFQPLIWRTQLRRADFALFQRQHAGVLAGTTHLVLPRLDLCAAWLVEWEGAAFQEVRSAAGAQARDNLGGARVDLQDVS